MIIKYPNHRFTGQRVALQGKPKYMYGEAGYIGNPGIMGTIIDVCDSGTLCVEFDEPIYDRNYQRVSDCAGRGKPLHCAYMNHNNVQFLLESVKPKPVITNQPDPFRYLKLLLK